MAGERTYRYNISVSNDGTQHLLIWEAQPASDQPARHRVLTFIENLNLFKSGFQKVFRFVTRRA